MDEEYTFSSSDTSVATVTSAGIINALKEGEFDLILTGKKSGKILKIRVSVGTPMYSITFYSNGDEWNEYYVYEGENIGELSSGPNIDGKVFMGWYTEEEGGELVSSSYVPTSDMKLYARYGNSIVSANIKSMNQVIRDAIAGCEGNPECGFGMPSPYTAYINSKERDIWTIEVSDIDEEYTFSSSDENIALVSSTGLITTLNEGNFIITVTGKKSGSTRSFDFKAEYYKYKICFETECRFINYGSNIGEVPTPDDPEGKRFDGWYTWDDVKIGSSYVPTSDMNLYARYKEYILIELLPPNEIVGGGSGTDEFGIIQYGFCAYVGAKPYISISDADENYIFESIDPTIATVSSEGQITALKEGFTYIIITGIDSHKTSTYRFDVVPH